MEDPSLSLLQIVNHIINQHPSLAYQIERLAAIAQGKGWGSATLETEVSQLQSALNTTPILAMDIGGNIGDYAAELRKKNPLLEIHVFEPAEINVHKLVNRFSEDRLVTVIPFALSDVTGSATLFSNESGAVGSSLTKRNLDHLNIPFDSTETVNTIRFEDYWKTHLQCRLIDMVKIDVEGHELNVLKGFGGALAATRAIQFEFGGTDIDSRTFFRDFWEFLTDQQHEIHRMTPHGLQKISGYSEEQECFSYSNFVSVNLRPCSSAAPPDSKR
jgi:FkbM family methyltransferase